MARSSTGGSIRRREDLGRWEGRYTASDGRRRSVYGKTRDETQERLRAALTAADAGIRPVRGRETVGEYLESWLATSIEQRCRPRTVASYRETCRRYIVPAIATVPLTKLTPEQVARMLGRLTARGDLSPTTVRYVCSVLRIALGRALKQGKVMRNVATLVDAPAKATPEIRPLDVAQVGTFLASVAGDRLEALYTVAIATGLRQGELFALRWSDVDVEAGTLTVRHTLERGTCRLAEPKTRRARRTVRLGPTSLATLREHRRVQLEERVAAGRRWRDLDLVFATAIGSPLDSRNVTHGLQVKLAAAGLPRQRFHDLRHATATLLIEQGEDLGVVSRILGHADFRTTSDVYAHLTAKMTERAAERMDVIVAGRATG